MYILALQLLAWEGRHAAEVPRGGRAYVVHCNP